MDKNPFHEHLDECKRCRQRPFDLCSTGHELLVAAVLDLGRFVEALEPRTKTDRSARMGMFDTYWPATPLVCLHCGQDPLGGVLWSPQIDRGSGYQSKAGPCELNTYREGQPSLDLYDAELENDDGALGATVDIYTKCANCDHWHEVMVELHAQWRIEGRDGEATEHDYSATPTEAGWYWYRAGSTEAKWRIAEVRGEVVRIGTVRWPVTRAGGQWGPRLVPPALPST